MESAEIKASICATCGKTASNFTCRGCVQDFCANHVVEHRSMLSDRLDEIVKQHDLLKESLNQESEKVHGNLVKQIDDWEAMSQETIRQAASEHRKQISNAPDRFKKGITERLDPINEELRKSRQEDTFVETDLDTWTAKVESLRTALIALPTVSIERDDYKASFITQYLVVEAVNDVFEESNGNAIIEEHGRVITHGFWDSYGAVRGKGE